MAVFIIFLAFEEEGGTVHSKISQTLLPFSTIVTGAICLGLEISCTIAIVGPGIIPIQYIYIMNINYNCYLPILHLPPLLPLLLLKSEEVAAEEEAFEDDVALLLLVVEEEGR